MATNFDSEKSQDQWEFKFFTPNYWASFITQYLIVGITKVVTGIVTVVVILLILFGGLWLAYTHLSTNVFLIILAVLMADVSLGIILRFIQSLR